MLNVQGSDAASSAHCDHEPAGTRSTASVTSPPKNGTRWNTSLPWVEFLSLSSLFPVAGIRMACVTPTNAMTSQRTCGKCGAPTNRSAPDNLCLNCLLDSALESDPAIEPGTPRDADAITQLDSHAPSATHHGPPLSQLSTLRRFADYELMEEIGRGGMGVVYRARQVSLDRIVAVKFLLFGPLASPEAIKRFRVEATAAGSLQHPSIVAIHEVGIHLDQHYLVMDYIEGQHLGKIVADGPLAPRRAARYVKGIAEAIQFAHERGILHRDLKPSNVLINPLDEPRVTDFGLAKRIDANSQLSPEDTQLTLSGQLLGSPNYMPPEQAAAKRGAMGKRSDVYALGAILYHLLTGRPPFVAPTVAETLQEVLNTEPLSPHVLNPGVPPDLETICLKCLEKDATKRYQSAAALAEDLVRFVNDEPIQARPVTRAERAWRWCRRNQKLAGSLASILMLLLVIAIGSPITAYRINRERQRAQRQLYAADMKLVQEAYDEGNLAPRHRTSRRSRPGHCRRGPSRL